MRLIIFLLSLLVIPVAVNSKHTNHPSQNRLPLDDTTNLNKGIIFYSSERAKPLKVLFDYYHHSLPSTKVGNHITTGSWINDEGRYGWDDFVHTNSFDPVYITLGNDYQISMSRAPFSEELLFHTDIAVIINNDDPQKNPAANIISDDEIAVLQKYVKEGGSLMVMLNAGSPNRQHESFEKAQLGKLLRSFGLDWNDDDTHYSDNFVEEAHPYFYDIHNFHYGAGCTIEILPEALNPEVLFNVYSDTSYTDRKVSGPGIVMVRPGKGKFLLIGDRGSWTGNMSRPWADNSRFLKQLFLYLHPDKGVNTPSYPAGKSWDYEITVSGLQAIPVANSLSKITRPNYKLFSPRPITNMPYFERTGDLKLTCKETTDGKASKMLVNLSDLKWFDRQPENQDEQSISFIVSRQGKVSKIEAKGYDAQWFAPDVSLLIALLPVDGLQPGNKWSSIESLRIPIIRGTDLPPIKKHNLDIVYVRDTLLDNVNCRLLRSSDEIWLDDLGVRVEDLLPEELVRKVDGSDYVYFSEHGGKLLSKREQWVDSETGVVLKARAQTRVIAWIHDKRKPVPDKNADKDNEMIVSLAHIVDFQLKRHCK